MAEADPARLDASEARPLHRARNWPRLILMLAVPLLVVIGVVALAWPKYPDRRWIRRLNRIQRGRRAMASPTRAAFKSRASS
jgi:hypothetical protein